MCQEVHPVRRHLLGLEVILGEEMAVPAVVGDEENQVVDRGKPGQVTLWISPSGGRRGWAVGGAGEGGRNVPAKAIVTSSGVIHDPRAGGDVVAAPFDGHHSGVRVDRRLCPGATKTEGYVTKLGDATGRRCRRRTLRVGRAVFGVDEQFPRGAGDKAIHLGGTAAQDGQVERPG